MGRPCSLLHQLHMTTRDRVWGDQISRLCAIALIKESTSRGEPGMLTRGAFVRCWRHFAPGCAAAVVSLFLLSGCGGGDTSKPAPVDQAQMKKAQEYMGN